MIALTGRLHPLLVHLPIGILLLAILLDWLSRRRFELLRPAVRISLLIGASMAVLSCITGYMLSLQDDYKADILSWHLAMGISTAVLSVGLFLLFDSSSVMLKKIYDGGIIILLIVISITGHLGGSLTHGANYLTEVLPSPIKQWFLKDDAEHVAIVNVQEALIYKDIIKPVLEEKCYSCHGETKQKGSLRLDLPEAILKGGKKGKTIVLQNPFDSEMIKRIYLPMNNEHHMPPKERSQITPAEVQLLQWWISKGASFDKKVNQITQPETIKSILKGLEANDENSFFVNHDISETPINKAPDSIIQKLRDKNIAVVPISKESNYLSVSFTGRPAATDEEISLLEPLRKNIIWLKLGSTKITDKALHQIGSFENLRRLSLDHTAISDNGMIELENLKQLQYLNVVGTSISVKGLMSLESLTKLKTLYVYQSALRKEDWSMLKTKLPNVTLDSGGYRVPSLPTDTVIVKLKL
ncbi:MAG: c-type cytochrome domain-containing protein [Chryseolinea sp.]